MKKSIIFFLIITIFNFSCNEKIEERHWDKIPRGRLLTDSEFFDLIDYDYFKNEKIQLALEKKDTLLAKKEIIKYFNTRTTSKYFFNAKSIKESVKDFVNRYPLEKNEILARSDEYINTYGSDVNWILPSKDLIGRQQNPNTIRFLARQSIAWDIAMSYHLTNKIGYLSIFLSQIRDFIDDYESGRTEAGRNDVFERFYAGHRLRNLLMVHNSLLSSPDYNFNDQIFMIKVFLLHGARLYDSCKKFHWGNHQLHGLAGLYEMTIMYPEFTVMNNWNDRAKEVIMEHISTEIKPDGFQFERASHYFKLDILNYFRISQISKLNNITLDNLFLSRFKKMFDAILKLSMPNKNLPVLQDAQDEYNSTKLNTDNRFNQLSSNNIAELKDPSESSYMSLGTLIFNEPIYRFFADDIFPHEFYWFFPKERIDSYKKINTKIPEIKSVSLDSSKYYVMRSGWGIDDLYMVIDGGLAKYKPDHTHGGILGIIAYANGEVILPNYRVRYSSPSYRTMKNSLVKNVAICDNILQGKDWISNHARTGFGIWDKLPKPTVDLWYTGSDFDIFSGTHNGYSEIGVDYSRSVIFFKPDSWLIIDKFKSNDYHKYQQIWQGEYQIDFKKNSIFSKNFKSKFSIMQADPSAMNITNKKNYEKHSVIFEKEGFKDYSFYTLITPMGSKDNKIPQISLFERSDYLQVKTEFNNKIYYYYEKKNYDIKLDELNTDATQVLVLYENNLLKSSLFVNGSYARLNKNNLVFDKSINVNYFNNRE